MAKRINKIVVKADTVVTPAPAVVPAATILDKIETTITEAVDVATAINQLVTVLSPTVQANLSSLQDSRRLTLATWDLLLPMWDSLVAKFKLKKEASWTELMQPAFEAIYPAKGWSLSTLKYYRGVCGSPEKRIAYIERGFDGSEESQNTVKSLKSDFQKLSEALAMVNKRIKKVKDFTLDIKEGVLLLLPVKQSA